MSDKRVIESWEELPVFKTVEEETLFWMESELSPTLMQGSMHLPSSKESTTITLRFDPRMLARIKRIARSRFLNYQSMMKQWLSERLEEEVRRVEDAEKSKEQS